MRCEAFDSDANRHETALGAAKSEECPRRRLSSLARVTRVTLLFPREPLHSGEYTTAQRTQRKFRFKPKTTAPRSCQECRRQSETQSGDATPLLSGPPASTFLSLSFDSLDAFLVCRRAARGVATANAAHALRHLRGPRRSAETSILVSQRDSLVVEFGQPTLSQVWPRNKS